MGYHFREQESFVRIVELTPDMRKRIEATIEHLLSILDAYDGDENLEDDGCGEPWLSSGAALHVSAWREDRGDDREFADDDFGEPEEEDADLGWLERINQADANRCAGFEGDPSDERELEGAAL